MSKALLNTNTNTATAESALLSGDQSNAVRFDEAAEVYAKKAVSLGKAKSGADKALFLTVQAGIVLVANDKQVQATVADATPNGQDANIAIVEAVCIANEWTSYVKLTKATSVKRDQWPLNEAGKKRMLELEKDQRSLHVAGDEKSNSDGLRKWLHSYEAYRK